MKKIKHTKYALWVLDVTKKLADDCMDFTIMPYPHNARSLLMCIFIIENLT